MRPSSFLELAAMKKGLIPSAAIASYFGGLDRISRRTNGFILGEL